MSSQMEINHFSGHRHNTEQNANGRRSFHMITVTEFCIILAKNVGVVHSLLRFSTLLWLWAGIGSWYEFVDKQSVRYIWTHSSMFKEQKEYNARDKMPRNYNTVLVYSLYQGIIWRKCSYVYSWLHPIMIWRVRFIIYQPSTKFWKNYY